MLRIQHFLSHLGLCSHRTLCMVDLCGQKEECALVYKMETAALKLALRM